MDALGRICAPHRSQPLRGCLGGRRHPLSHFPMPFPVVARAPATGTRCTADANSIACRHASTEPTATRTRERERVGRPRPRKQPTVGRRYNRTHSCAFAIDGARRSQVQNCRVNGESPIAEGFLVRVAERLRALTDKSARAVLDEMLASVTRQLRELSEFATPSRRRWKLQVSSMQQNGRSSNRPATVENVVELLLELGGRKARNELLARLRSATYRPSPPPKTSGSRRNSEASPSR
jgi:hypothetical protein